VSFSDIVQFVGTGSVPVIVAGTVYGVFELGEKLASQRAKDALSKWLLTFNVQKAGAMPEGTHIEKAPFDQSAVAAALAFIASVAILLVSAEISRIGAAA
jgi:hypothetical protein